MPTPADIAKGDEVTLMVTGATGRYRAVCVEAFSVSRIGRTPTFRLIGEGTDDPLLKPGDYIITEWPVK